MEDQEDQPRELEDLEERGLQERELEDLEEQGLQERLQDQEDRGVDDELGLKEELLQKGQNLRRQG